MDVLFILSLIFLYFSVIIILLFFVTPINRKIIITDLVWGLLFLIITAMFFVYQLRSQSRDGLLIFIVFPGHFIINSIFLLVQGLITINQENKQKMLMQKKRCFFIHIIILFGLYFIDAIYWNPNIKWVCYILVFTFFNYILFDYVFLKVIGVLQPPFYKKLIKNEIDKWKSAVNKT